jgi:hypothetical protein
MKFVNDAFALEDGEEAPPSYSPRPRFLHHKSDLFIRTLKNQSSICVSVTKNISRVLGMFLGQILYATFVGDFKVKLLWATCW